MKRSPIARKSATKKRKPAARCSYSNRCSRRPSVLLEDGERLCGTHATWTADKLLGDLVRARDGECKLASFNRLPCQGPLSACHIIPKGRYPSVRWVPLNIVAGCASHHMAFDTSPVEKEAWIYAYLGRVEYDGLKQLALDTSRPPVADVIQQYRELAVLA